jgi:hypothetical protein
VSSGWAAFEETAVFRQLAWLCVIVCVLRDCASGQTALPIARESESQGWKIVETANFRCQSQLEWAAARELAASCEAWKAALQMHWFGDEQALTWQPRCEVIVHPTQAGYNQTLGRPGDRSVGCTSLKCDGGRVVYRRIDVRSDAIDWSNAALPHEMTHVVLADRFGDKLMPSWINEGVAMLAEDEAKQRLRWTDLRSTLRTRPRYHLGDLMRVTNHPPASLRDAFYGQSLSLVGFLVEQADRETFWKFTGRLAQTSPEKALSEIYGYRSVDELQLAWRSWVERTAEPDFSAARPRHSQAAPAVLIVQDREPMSSTGANTVVTD